MNHWIDYVLFVAFLGVSIGIGLFFSLTGGRQRTTEEFIMADRSLKVLPTTLSLLVSFQSAIMIIGHTAEIYVGGTSAWANSLISFTLALLIAAWIFVPWFYRLKITSINKIFELRFGSKLLRVWGAILSILSQLGYMGTAMLAPALALETGTGFPAKASIPIMAVVCITYTTLGGMKAVIWTDVFQAVMMLTGILTVMIKGLVIVGGFGEAFRLISEGDRLTGFDFSPDPTVRHTIWGFTFGYSTLWIAVYALSQASIQRVCALKTLRQARITVLLNVPILVVMTSLVYFNGVVVVAYYINKGCDPIHSGVISKPNNLLPLFVRDVFKNAPGFGGLFLATLYSGALSSVSSSLSGATANIWDDILRWNLPNISEYKASVINKIFVVIFGLLAVSFAFVVNHLSGPLTQVSLAISGSLFGPISGLFLITGIRVFSWCNSKGTLLGSIVGLVISVWQTVGGEFTPRSKPYLPHFTITNCTTSFNITSNSQQDINPTSTTNIFYDLSYLWKTTFGCVTTMLACMACSLIINILQKEREKIDDSPCLFLQLGLKPHTSNRLRTDINSARKDDVSSEELEALNIGVKPPNNDK